MNNSNPVPQHSQGTGRSEGPLNWGKSRNMTLLNALRIGPRIWLAISLPVVAALLGAAQIDAEKIADINAAARTEQVAGLAIEVSATVHELQKERGMSSAFAASRGERMRDERGRQIALTDRRRGTLDAAMVELGHGFGDELAASIERARRETAGLTALRAETDRLDLGAPLVIGRYSTLIDALLGVAEKLSAIGTDPEIGNMISAYLELMQAKESAGRERATGAAALASGAVGDDMKQRLAALAAVQATHIKSFAARATPDQRRALQSAMETPAATELVTLRKSVLEGVAAEVGVDRWFAAATRRIDLMKEVEDGLAGQLSLAIARIKSDAWHTVLVVSGGIAAALVLIGLVVVVLARSITRPAGRLTEAMLALAGGNLTAEVPAAERGDEIGAMARAVLVFKRQAAAVAAMEAERDALRLRAEQDRRSALAHMADTIESETGHVVAKVTDGSDRANGVAQDMAVAARRVEDNAQRVAAAAEQSLANAQTVAGAAEELTASIQAITGQVGNSSTMVTEAVVAADGAMATVAKLHESMARVDHVVTMIAGFAAQTRLLALNATIESARAGDAGKGFAVVAHEVKRLADQTGSQADEISSRIEELKAMAGGVGSAIASLVDRIRGVEEISSAIALSVEQQDAATAEIARSVTQSADAAREVTERIIVVANEARHTGTEAANVTALLTEMATQVGELGHVLTRVVRTAAPEVDRRCESREEVDAPAHLTADGHDFDGRLANLSKHGARVVGVPDVTADQVVITSPSLPAPRPFKVVEHRNGLLRMRTPHGAPTG